MIKVCAALIGALLFVAGSPAFAGGGTLTGDQVKRFIASFDDVKKVSDDFKDEGHDTLFDINAQPKDEDIFKPFSTAMTQLKAKYPGDYARIGAAVKPHGFSVESWAETGDHVILAYAAEKMERENPGELEQAEKEMSAMDPQTMAMMPDSAKAQMQASLAMIKMIKEAPPEDREAIGPYFDQLETMFDGKDG